MPPKQSLTIAGRLRLPFTQGIIFVFSTTDKTKLVERLGSWSPERLREQFLGIAHRLSQSFYKYFLEKFLGVSDTSFKKGLTIHLPPTELLNPAAKRSGRKLGKADAVLFLISVPIENEGFWNFGRGKGNAAFGIRARKIFFRDCRNGCRVGIKDPDDIPNSDILIVSDV